MCLLPKKNSWTRTRIFISASFTRTEIWVPISGRVDCAAVTLWALVKPKPWITRTFQDLADHQWHNMRWKSHSWDPPHAAHSSCEWIGRTECAWRTVWLYFWDSLPEWIRLSSRSTRMMAWDGWVEATCSHCCPLASRYSICLAQWGSLLLPFPCSSAMLPLK